MALGVPGVGGAFPGASLASRWDPKSWVGLVAANALGLIRGGGGPTALEVLHIRLAPASCDMYCVRSWTPIAPLGGATSSTPPTSRRTATTSLPHALGIITLSPTCNRPDRPTDRVHKSAQAGDKTDTAVRKTRSFLTHPAGGPGRASSATFSSQPRHERALKKDSISHRETRTNIWPKMSAPKQRKVAIVGSRSVGTSG